MTKFKEYIEEENQQKIDEIDKSQKLDKKIKAEIEKNIKNT